MTSHGEERAEFHKRIDSALNFIGDHFSSLKQQIANQQGAVVAELQTVEKKLDKIIDLLQSQNSK